MSDQEKYSPAGATGTRIYAVRRWDKHFENAESRRYKHLRWVPIPNKHDGRGYRRLLTDHRAQAVNVFAAWNLICQVASKMPVRGILCDDDGALSPGDLAAKTGFPEEIFAQAFTVLSERRIRWLVVVPAVEARRIFGHLPEVLEAIGEKAPEPIRGTITAACLRRLCGDIAANKGNWFYDNCKVPLTVASPASSLVAHVEPFIGRLTEKQVVEAWAEAVKRTHEAITDGSERAKKSPGGYVCRTWANLMGEVKN